MTTLLLGFTVASLVQLLLLGLFHSAAAALDAFDNWRLRWRQKRGLPPYKSMEYDEATARRYGIPRRKPWEERLRDLLQKELW